MEMGVAAHNFFFIYFNATNKRFLFLLLQRDFHLKIEKRKFNEIIIPSMANCCVLWSRVIYKVALLYFKRT